MKTSCSRLLELQIVTEPDLAFRCLRVVVEVMALHPWESRIECTVLYLNLYLNLGVKPA
jgi:hypothetical protein